MNVQYNLEQNSEVTFQVLDLLGRIRAEWNEGSQSQGTHIIEISSEELEAGN